jgi:glycerol-3-phosphate cytidylyltransferase
MDAFKSILGREDYLMCSSHVFWKKLQSLKGFQLEIGGAFNGSLIIDGQKFFIKIIQDEGLQKMNNYGLKTNMKIYVGGTFDLFHWGHVELLRKCAELGDVWVSLNTDKFCSEYKRLPIMNFEERKRALEACRYVAGVVENEGGHNSGITIKAVAPNIIVHADDWMGESYLRQLGITQEFLDENKIKIVYFPYTKSISSTEIIKRCQR